MDETISSKKRSRETKEEFKRKQDEFLDVYSLYLETGLRWIKEESILKAYELHLMDSDFSFEI